MASESFFLQMVPGIKVSSSIIKCMAREQLLTVKGKCLPVSLSMVSPRCRLKKKQLKEGEFKKKIPRWRQ